MFARHKAGLPASDLAVPTFLALLFVAGVSLLNYDTASIPFSMAAEDEFAFFRVVLRMYDSLWPFDARNFFNISFQTYGMAWFLSQLMVGAPFFALSDWDSAILAFRTLPSLWAAGTVVLASALCLRVTGCRTAAAICGLWLVCMPGFWTNAMWTHPDHMMTFFVVAAIYRAWLSATSRRDIIAVAALFAVAMSSKFPAVLFWPAVGILFTDFRGGIAAAVGRVAMLGLATLGFYVVFDPYLLHPLGAWALWDDLLRNIESNRTNHGLYTVPTFSEKLGLLHQYYINGITIIVVALAFLVARVRSNQFALAIAAGILVPAAMMMTANKLWESYYLTPFCLLPVLSISVAGHDRRARLLLAAGAFFTATGWWSLVPNAHYAGLSRHAVVAEAAAVSTAIAAAPAPVHSIAISPFTALSPELAGLRPSAIRTIDGQRFEEAVLGVSHIVLRKDDIYFDDAHLADATRQNLPYVAERQRLRGEVRRMRAGAHPDFMQCSETKGLVILCRKFPRMDPSDTSER